MRVVLTGADGFVGHAVLPLLRDAGHAVVANDLSGNGGHWVHGEITDAAVLSRLFDGGCDAVIHLATIAGAAAEANPERAWRVNVDGMRQVADAAARAGTCPRFVFASSVAVLGDPLPSAGVDDATPAAPRLVYGAHKRIAEEWLAVLGRRGSISPVALRLPGIVARPSGAGTALKSAFMSDVFHALAERRHYTLPVSGAARMWMMSAEIAARNLVHALALPPAAAPAAMNLPAVHVSIAALVEAIAQATGADATLVGHDPDPGLEAQFGAYPPLDAKAARAAGFVDDGDIGALVARALSAIGKVYA